MLNRFSCVACELHQTCRGPISPSEPSNPLLVICGDRPGAIEDMMGSHFIGPIGEILDDAMVSADLARHDAVLLNTVLCATPGNRDATKKEMDVCVAKNILPLVEKYKSLPWVLMGAHAIKLIGGLSGGVRQNLGHRWVSKHGLKCYACPNPAAVKRGIYRTDQIARILRSALGRLTIVEITKPIARVIAVDTETTGLDFYRDARPFIATSCDGKLSKLYELDSASERADLQKDIDSADVVVMANALFDCGHLRSIGVNVDLRRTFDVQWSASADDSGNCPYKLERLGDYYFKNGGAHKRKLDERLKQILAERGEKTLSGGFKSIPRENLNSYALFDATLTYALYNHPDMARARDENDAYIARERRLLETSQHIEDRGFLIDPSRIQDAIRSMETKRDRALADLRMHPDVRPDFPDFNPSSHVQTRKLLDQLEIYSPEKTKTGSPSYGKFALSLIESDVVKLILAYRSYRLLAGGALQSLPLATDSNNRVHPSFHSTGTESGRFTCKTRAETKDERVNLHGIPKDKKVRSVFVAPEGWSIVSMDMSQIENRGTAHFAGARKLIDGYNADPNMDFYAAIASEICQRKIDKSIPEDAKIRQDTKAVVLAKGYGAGYKKISKMIRKSPEYTQEFIARYDQAIPELHDFMARVGSDVYKKGKVRVFDWESPVDRRVAYQGVNRIIQGVCAVHLKRLLNEIDSIIAGHDDIYAVLHVHDEIVFEIKTSRLSHWLPMLKEIMESGWDWKVPVVVNTEVGNDWGYTKPYEYERTR